MPIPVANIYYLLCYAWDEFAPRQMASVITEECPDTLHLFASLLATGVRALHRRGLETGYMEWQEAIPGVRGRIEMGATLRCMATQPKRVVCAFDELSTDILTNQIIKATMAAVLGEPTVERAVRRELRDARKLLAAVGDIQLESRLFHQVQLHRNNRIYSFLLSVCRFFFESLEAQEESGRYRFRDVAREPERMRRIFEKFVRTFLQRHVGAGSKVSRDRMAWCASPVDGADLKLLPQMETDVTIRWPHRTMVIECKYMEALYDNRFLAEKFHPVHLYQLASYIRNLESRSGPDATAEGLLLYPTVGESLHQTYILQGHRVRVATLELNRRWSEIEVQLLALVQ